MQYLQIVMVVYLHRDLLSTVMLVIMNLDYQLGKVII